MSKLEAAAIRAGGETSWSVLPGNGGVRRFISRAQPIGEKPIAEIKGELFGGLDAAPFSFRRKPQTHKKEQQQ